jgi:hypothetical protein
MSYIGALGVNTFDDEIEDANNILVDRIVSDINHTSNYVLVTSNILVGCIRDTSNVLVQRITDEVGHTSNYADRLDLRLKVLEGTEGTEGDISLGIPPIPSTGGFATAAAIAALTAASYLGGVSVLSMILSLEIEVDSNKTEADKIGGWSSNYSDKVGVWGSNYTDLQGKYTSNYADKVGIWGSNYTDLQVKYTSNYADKVGIWGSNYTDLVGKYTSNYADKVGIWGSNYSDKVGIWGSNYSDKVGIWSSNYTDLQVKYTSNYADKVGVWGSNYVLNTSNILVKRITDEVRYTSNYTERLIAEIGTSTNYWTEESTNNIYLNKTGNVGIGTNIPQTKLHIYQDTINDTKLTIQNNFTSGGAGGAITSSPTATTTAINGLYTTMVFTYTTETAGAGTGQTLYTITAPAGGITCDILLVAGGGGGGDPHGGGGGAGQLILIHQATLNGTYSVKVGRGGTGGIYITTAPTKGRNSEIANSSITVIAEGGGANSSTSSDKNGGSGAGGDAFTGGGGTSGGGNKDTTVDLFPSATVYSRGNNGGNEGTNPSRLGGGGGGGAGQEGQPDSFSIPGKGGDGLSGITAINYDFQTNFGNYGRLEADGKYYFAGGGGGGNSTVSNGSKGGGGSGGVGGNNIGVNGIANTGSGGGGGGGGGNAVGGAGGSGIVIIRYLTPSSSTSSSLVLVRGTTTDGVVDYSVGNYDGDFKVKSVNAGTPTDRMIINSSGNVGIGGSVGIGTTALTQLHIYNATASTLRLETGASGKSSIEFSVGALTDTITDYRIINDAYEMKFQYQDNLVSYGATGSDIMVINDKGTDYKKKVYFDDVVGIKTTPDPLYSMDVSGNCRYLSGNVGIGVEPSTGYRLNVAGDVNIQGIGNKYYVNNLPVVSSQWATSGTTIEYGGGSVGIGTSALSYKLNVNGSINCTSILVNGATLDYNALNNKPITLVPTTTNLQLATGYNFLLGGTLSTTGLIEITRPIAGTNDIINLIYDAQNNLKFQQRYLGVNDVRYGIIQRDANVETVSIAFYKGNVGIGTNDPVGYRLNVNGTTSLNGTTYINGNVGIGTTNPNRILQVGTGGRLGISNTSSSFTLIGTAEDVSIPNTRISIFGYNSTGFNGVIQYITTGTGYHAFINQSLGDATQLERMRIANNGNVGIGTTDTSTYRLNVAGDVNCSGAFRVGGVAITGGSKWTTATDTTRIYYNTGNVGIGTTNPTTAKLVITTTAGSVGLDMASSDSYAEMRVIRNSLNAIDKNMYFGFSSGAGSILRLYSNNAETLRCESGSVFIPNGSLTTPSYILTNDAVYARNGYDTRIRSDSSGMYLEMGDIGNNNYLKFGAYNGATYMFSGASRNIVFNTNGYIWQFVNNGLSHNANNNTVWNIASDHRIKENIKKANLNICYNNVKNINLYRFNYINGFNKGTQHDKTQLGFIAQQVQQHYPKSVFRSKTRIEDKREIPDLASVSTDQINYTLFGAVKQLMKVVEKQSKRIKKLEMQLGIIDDDIADEADDDADEPYERIICDEVDIDTIEPSEPEGV